MFSVNCLLLLDVDSKHLLLCMTQFMVSNQFVSVRKKTFSADERTTSKWLNCPSRVVISWRGFPTCKTYMENGRLAIY